MSGKIKNILTICLVGGILFGMAFWCWAKPQELFSDSERRTLETRPEFNIQNLLSGNFTNNFETYAQDQFPMRDRFRTLKAVTTLYALQQSDHHQLYLADGHISRMNYPLNQDMLAHSAEHIQKIYNRYLSKHPENIYFCIIPDKNYFLAEKNGYLSSDYTELVSYMRERVPAKYIDIFPLLSAEDYYNTDTHWRQNKILDVAQQIAAEMGVALDAEYEEEYFDLPFYGVYYGQSALPLRPDHITYLQNDILKQCRIIDYDTGEPDESALYDLTKLYGKDAYETFLSGASAIQVIESPLAETEKELIIFRDSFASSLAPLFAEGYSKITLIDTRYISSEILEKYITFDTQDVLFLYSTILLNDSLALK